MHDFIKLQKEIIVGNKGIKLNAETFVRRHSKDRMIVLVKALTSYTSILAKKIKKMHDR